MSNLDWDFFRKNKVKSQPYKNISILPSSRSSEGETVIVGICGSIHAYSDPNNTLTSHGDNTPTDYGDSPESKNRDF